MTIDKPRRTEDLRRLWQEAFGDEDAFLDAFFQTAFSEDRCLCAMEGNTLQGALYWMDAQLHGQKWAYLYAVATALHSRGKGVCHTLMAAAHEKLEQAGYGVEVLKDIRHAIDADTSDLLDVLEYISFATTPMERAERAERLKAYAEALPQAQ
jgi:predicted GNAT superfamily acetyltransferase